MDTKFSVLILGSASASPALHRNPTSQLVTISNQLFLVDCGEGTQQRLREHKVKFQRINHIFISHLHGDHYFGLIGLLQTMNLIGRTTDINVYGPADLKKIIDLQLSCSQTMLNYTLNFHAVQADYPAVVWEDDKVEVKSIILEHRIPCTGYLFQEKLKLRRILPERIAAFNVPKYALNTLKLGEDFIDKTGKKIKNEQLTQSPLPSFSYAFCSDTRYSEALIPQIKGVNMLYHEATFMDEHEARATKTYHSTASQAAKIAKLSGAKCLIIGHFSNRYKKLDGLLGEAQAIFSNTKLAIEGEEFEVSKLA